jgi:alpha-galactosidase
MDLMESEGYLDLGYRYLIIECYDHLRDEQGNWIPNPEKFPEGYGPVVEYAHERGFGIKVYTDAGACGCSCGCECGWRGSLGNYERDAIAWAAFGFDGAKIDWCGGRSAGLDPETYYRQFYDTIMQHIDKPFDLEICCWGWGNPWEWGRFAGSMWRTAMDIDGWNGHHPGGIWKALLRNVDSNRHPDTTFVGPGKGFNYADMLLTGLPGGLTETEERTQFSLWAIMASPLYLSTDLFNLPDYAKRIVQNEEVIHVDQDPLGLQGDVIKESGDGNVQVWSKPLSDEGMALAFFNRDSVNREITLHWDELGLGTKVKVRDLWEHKDLGICKKRISVEIRPHETLLYKVNAK